MHFVILLYIVGLLIMDLICMYHLLQYRGMRRYRWGIRMCSALSVLAVVCAVAPSMRFIELL